MWFSGFFDGGVTGLGELEVDVLQVQRGLALVSPSRGGRFFEGHHIVVEERWLKYAE